jgi:hypothetical protein
MFITALNTLAKLGVRRGAQQQRNQ